MDENKYFLVKYKGNKNFICVLYHRDNKYLCLYGRTTIPEIEQNIDVLEICAPYKNIHEPFTRACNAMFSTNFVCSQNNHNLFTVLALNKEEDFDIVYTVLESVYGND